MRRSQNWCLILFSRFRRRRLLSASAPIFPSVALHSQNPDVLSVYGNPPQYSDLEESTMRKMILWFIVKLRPLLTTPAAVLRARRPGKWRPLRHCCRGWPNWESASQLWLRSSTANCAERHVPSGPASCVCVCRSNKLHELVQWHFEEHRPHCLPIPRSELIQGRQEANITQHSLKIMLP
ncbi:hypothetical protein C8R45DRAFT_283358 [Mycena sanguinolenta]|nr:hypothetical protein C8R45DRAFT_283358 [Mycena sanguinolenta]